MRLLVTAAVVCGEVLCCGRGAKPVGERPTAPLMERESPWRADVVLGFDERPADVDAVVRALSRVPGVTGAQSRDGARWVRVWGDRRVVGRMIRAGGEAGAKLVPAGEVRVAIAHAGEKGRLGAVGAALWRMAGVLDVEVESDGADAVARVWVRPGVTAADVARVAR